MDPFAADSVPLQDSCFFVYLHFVGACTCFIQTRMFIKFTTPCFWSITNFIYKIEVLLHDLSSKLRITKLDCLIYLIVLTV